MRRLIFTILVLSFSSFTFANDPAPVGYWKTIDDVTGKAQSIIKIWEDGSHHLQGTIVKVFPEASAKPIKICSACDGERHNQPILGMTILTNLKLDEDEWVNGRILDPSSGKTYKCNVRAIADGKKLRVRGYIGLPILGRTQTWLRADEPTLA